MGKAKGWKDGGEDDEEQGDAASVPCDPRVQACRGGHARRQEECVAVLVAARKAGRGTGKGIRPRGAILKKEEKCQKKRNNFPKRPGFSA